MKTLASTPEEMAAELRAEPRLHYLYRDNARCGERAWMAIEMRSEGVPFAEIDRRLGYRKGVSRGVVANHVSRELLQLWTEQVSSPNPAP